MSRASHSSSLRPQELTPRRTAAPWGGAEAGAAKDRRIVLAPTRCHRRSVWGVIMNEPPPIPRERPARRGQEGPVAALQLRGPDGPAEDLRLVA